MAFSDLMSSLFPSSGFSPELGSLMATDPEKAARHLAAQGVPPPPAPGTAPYNPLAAPALTNFSNMPMGVPQTQQTAPAPRIPPQAEQSPLPFGKVPTESVTSDPLSGVAPDATSPMGGIGNLAKMLSGVKAPPNPEFQKIRSPDAPHPVAIPQGSPVAALLAKAVAGDPQAMMTLRAAIGGGR